MQQDKFFQDTREDRATNQKNSQDIARAAAGERVREFDLKRQTHDEELAARREAAAKKEQDKLDALTFPFEGGTVAPKPGSRPKDAEGYKKQASFQTKSLEGLRSIKGSLESVADSLSRGDLGGVADAQADIGAKIQEVALANAIASGGGKPTKQELDALEGAVGADLLSPRNLAGLMSAVAGDPEKAKKLLLRKVTTLHDLNKHSFLKQLETAGFDVQGVQSSSPEAKKKVRFNPETGEVEAVP